jgi:AmmeMemoRadiSam system protein B
MITTRPPAVAGTFYPADPGALAALVEGFLHEAPAPKGAVPKAIVAPHAGYVYSGPIAGSAFRAVAAAAETIERVVLVGPSHYVPIRGLALPGDPWFSTPLGEVRVEGVGRGCRSGCRRCG